MHFYQDERVALFIDGSNLYATAKTLGFDIDYKRLLGYFRHSRRTHLHLRPDTIGEREVVHFAFFHSRFEHSLWQIPLAWLRHGRLPAQPPGEVESLRPEPA